MFTIKAYRDDGRMRIVDCETLTILRATNEKFDEIAEVTMHVGSGNDFRFDIMPDSVARHKKSQELEKISARLRDAVISDDSSTSTVNGVPVYQCIIVENRYGKTTEILGSRSPLPTELAGKQHGGTTMTDNPYSR